MQSEELVAYIVRALVDEPEQVRVDVNPGEVATTYIVHVAPGDLGKAIGKQGRLANALRVIVKAAAMKEKRKAYVEIFGEDSTGHE